MAREGSVAPKERVSIVYKPAGQGMSEVELPLKILAMGDYTGRLDDRPVEERKPINIDKDNFGAVMSEQKLGLDIAVKDKLSEDPNADLGLSLKFDSLKDFTPEGVLQQVPELQKLMQLRDALTALKGPLGNLPGFRKRLRDVLDDETARNRLLAELNAQDESKDESKKDEGN